MNECALCQTGPNKEFVSMLRDLDGGREISPHFLKQLAGYGLTTAEILYHLPDHPGLLQTFVWQDYDVAPRFPCLIRFLNFWRNELEGPLHSVRVGHSRLIKPTEIAVHAEFRLN